MPIPVFQYFLFVQILPRHRDQRVDLAVEPCRPVAYEFTTGTAARIFSRSVLEGTRFELAQPTLLIAQAIGSAGRVVAAKAPCLGTTPDSLGAAFRDGTRGANIRLCVAEETGIVRAAHQAPTGGLIKNQMVGLMCGGRN